MDQPARQQGLFVFHPATHPPVEIIAAFKGQAWPPENKMNLIKLLNYVVNDGLMLPLFGGEENKNAALFDRLLNAKLNTGIMCLKAQFPDLYEYSLKLGDNPDMQKYLEEIQTQFGYTFVVHPHKWPETHFSVPVNDPIANVIKANQPKCITSRQNGFALTFSDQPSGIQPNLVSGSDKTQTASQNTKVPYSQETFFPLYLHAAKERLAKKNALNQVPNQATNPFSTLAKL